MDDSYVVKVGERGQATIPRQLREHLGISGSDYVVFKLNKDGSIRVLKAEIKTGDKEKPKKKLK